jgi:hypothetical protein
MAKRILYADRYELKTAFIDKCQMLDITTEEGLAVAKITDSQWKSIGTKGMTLRIRARMEKFIGEQKDVQPKIEESTIGDEESQFGEPKKKNKISHLKGCVPYEERNPVEIDTTMKILYTVVGLSQTGIAKLFECSSPNINKRLMRLLGNDQ